MTLGNCECDKKGWVCSGRDGVVMEGRWRWLCNSVFGRREKMRSKSRRWRRIRSNGNDEGYIKGRRQTELLMVMEFGKKRRKRMNLSFRFWKWAK